MNAFRAHELDPTLNVDDRPQPPARCCSFGLPIRAKTVDYELSPMSAVDLE